MNLEPWTVLAIIMEHVLVRIIMVVINAILVLKDFLDFQIVKVSSIQYDFFCKILNPIMKIFIMVLFFKGCSCHEEGSESTTCSSTGQCVCKNNVAGNLCDQCVDLMYGFPNCQGLFLKILIN